MNKKISDKRYYSLHNIPIKVGDKMWYKGQNCVIEKIDLTEDNDYGAYVVGEDFKIGWNFLDINSLIYYNSFTEEERKKYVDDRNPKLIQEKLNKLEQEYKEILSKDKIISKYKYEMSKVSHNYVNDLVRIKKEIEDIKEFVKKEWIKLP